jgi:Zn-dependent peptidase ImmA (M78 family)
VNNVAISKPSVDFLDVVSDTVLKQQWYGEYLRETGALEVQFIGSCTPGEGFQRVAEKVRTALSIDHQARAACGTWEEFLGYITHKAEDLGIVVMQRGIVGNYTQRPLDVNEFRGFAIADDFAPLVFINSRDAKAAKNFTIVHELCHLWIGASGISNPDLRERSDQETNSIERFCNKVAAEVLAPREDLAQRWSLGKSLKWNVENLARYYRVSRYVVVRQAFEISKITHPQFVDYLDKNPYFLKPAAPKEEDEGGNFYNTFAARNGRRLISGVLNALDQHKVTYRDASALLGIKIATLKRVAERLG